MLGCHAAVYLPRHKSGRNKGFGFTTFETEDELNLVLQVLIPLPALCVDPAAVNQ